MKKFLLPCLVFLGTLLTAQVSYTQDWTTAGLNSWTGTVFSNNTTANQICGTAGGTIRGNRYSANTGQFTSPLLSGNNQGLITMNFDYKITNYTGGGTTATPAANIGTIKVEYASSVTGTWTTAFTINTSNHTAANTCASKSVTFTPSSGNLYVRFNVASASGADCYYYFDNVSISQGAGPSCLSPSNLTSSNLTTSSVDLNWTAPTSAPASGYEYYYSASNTEPTSSTTPSGTSTTTTVSLSGLTPTTNYYAWVRSACSASDKSAWSPVYTFRTGHCVPSGGSITTYYLNNITTTGATTNLSYTASAYSGYVDNSATSFSNYAGGTFTYSLASAGSSTYYYYIWVDWNNDLDFADSGETMVATTAYAAANTGNFVIPTTQAIGNYRARFATSYSGAITACGPATGGGNYVDFTVSVVSTPSCVSPTALAASGTTTTSTTVSWTAPTTAPASGYELYYSNSGTAPTSSTTPTTTGITGVSTSLSGLSAGSSYYVWVRSKCSSTDTSAWSTSLLVNTVCPTSFDASYSQNFESTSATLIPICTTRENLSGAGSWQANNTIAGFGGNALLCFYSTTTAANAWFYTPGVNLTAGKTYKITYKYSGGFADGSYTDRLKVAYGTSAASASMTNALNDHSAINTGSTTYLPGEKTFTPTTTGVYYFGFNAYSIADQNYVGIDDISIVDTGTLAVTDLSKAAISVYPNPFTDVLKISDVKGVKSISVSDVSGREVKSLAPSAELNLSNLKTGLYIVNLKMEDGSVKSFKAIKK